MPEKTTGRLDWLTHLCLGVGTESADVCGFGHVKGYWKEFMTAWISLII